MVPLRIRFGDQCTPLTPCVPLSLSLRNPLALMEEEKKEHEAKIKKMEQEMEQVFEIKVKEKLQKLRDNENDVSTSAEFDGF